MIKRFIIKFNHKFCKCVIYGRGGSSSFFVNGLLSKYAYANLKLIYSNDIYYIENIVFLKLLSHHLVFLHFQILLGCLFFLIYLNDIKSFGVEFFYIIKLHNYKHHNNMF